LSVKETPEYYQLAVYIPRVTLFMTSSVTVLISLTWENKSTR